MTKMILSIILILVWKRFKKQRCLQSTNQDEWESSAFVSNATRMTFLWRGYASNWQSAKVRAIVLIVIPLSVITQSFEPITLAVICATYRLSGLWTQMHFYVFLLLIANYYTHGFTLTADLATFSQFVIKANTFWLFGRVLGSWSVVAIFHKYGCQMK